MTDIYGRGMKLQAVAINIAKDRKEAIKDVNLFRISKFTKSDEYLVKLYAELTGFCDDISQELRDRSAKRERENHYYECPHCCGKGAVGDPDHIESDDGIDNIR